MQNLQSATGGGGEDAVRWLTIAERLLSARDLIPSRSFATRARRANPSLASKADEILAVVETLIAGDNRIINDQPDWYAVLGLTPQQGADENLVATNYQKLMLILNPKRNKYSFADQAYRQVIQAWSVLSNPSRKSVFDSQLVLYLQTRQRYMGSFNNPSPTMHHNSIYFGSSAARGNSQPPMHVLETSFIGGNISPVQPMAAGSGGLSRQPQNFTANNVFGLGSGRNLNHELFNNPTVGTATQQCYPSLFVGNSSVSASAARENYPIFAGNSSATDSAAAATWQQNYLTNFGNSFSPSSSITAMATGQPSYSTIGGFSSSAAAMARQESYSPLVGNSPASASTTTAMQRQLLSNCTQSQQICSIVRDEAGQNPNLSPDNFNGENSGILQQLVYDDESVFWTVCPYCFYLYEYPRMYTDCALLCHHCRRTSQAVAVQPPPFLDMKHKIYYTWGFLPFGISMDYFEKQKNNAAANNWATPALPSTEIHDFMEGDVHGEVRSSGLRVSAAGDNAFTDTFQTTRGFGFGSLVDIDETSNHEAIHVHGNGAMEMMSNVSMEMNNTCSDKGKGIVDASVYAMAMSDMEIGEFDMLEMAVHDGNIQAENVEMNFGTVIQSLFDDNGKGFDAKNAAVFPTLTGILYMITGETSIMGLGSYAGTQFDDLGIDFNEEINAFLDKGKNVMDHAIVCPTVMEMPNMIEGESSAMGSGINAGKQPVNMVMNFGEVMSPIFENGESSMMGLLVNTSEQSRDMELNDFDFDINMEFGSETRDPPSTSDPRNGLDCMEDDCNECDKSNFFEGLDELFIKLPYASVFNNYNSPTVA